MNFAIDLADKSDLAPAEFFSPVGFFNLGLEAVGNLG
jgi:hypothetical protein